MNPIYRFIIGGITGLTISIWWKFNTWEFWALLILFSIIATTIETLMEKE